MTEKDRRRAERLDAALPATLATIESIDISGQTVNIGQWGVLLRARRRVPVLLQFNGKQYRGRIVRVSSRDPETIDYAIELDDRIDANVLQSASTAARGSVARTGSKTEQTIDLHDKSAVLEGGPAHR
jgi:hypothetical protein